MVARSLCCSTNPATHQPPCPQVWLDSLANGSVPCFVPIDPAFRIGTPALLSLESSPFEYTCGQGARPRHMQCRCSYSLIVTDGGNSFCVVCARPRLLLTPQNMALSLAPSALVADCEAVFGLWTLSMILFGFVVLYEIIFVLVEGSVHLSST